MEESREAYDIAVAVVEDDGEIRGLMETLIDRSPGFRCKLVFGDCESALEPIRTELPDVVLMDIELPGMSGIEGVQRLKDSVPGTDFIMLTIRDDEESIFRSLCAGATGYLLKDTPPAQLLEGIREVHRGGSPMTPRIARRIIESFTPSSPSPLTGRETEILARLCDGESYSAIAEALYLSGHTVRAHIKNIYRKLHVSSRGEAVKTALKKRWAENRPRQISPSGALPERYGLVTFETENESHHEPIHPDRRAPSSRFSRGGFLQQEQRD